MQDDKSKTPYIGLFVTCLVDLIRPSVGFASIKLLEDAGCRIGVPESQVCCGQPAYNSGDQKNAEDVARQVIQAFEEFDYVVAPSGSCAAMIRVHYPTLFADDTGMKDRAAALASKTYELTSFLVDVLNIEEIQAQLAGKATYHDSCSGLRELGVKNQPRRLLSSVEGLALEEYEGAESCCGFGGTFCVKYSDISDSMVQSRMDELAKTGADLLVGGDLGCLLNIQGKLSRAAESQKGPKIKVRHVAEVLAGHTDDPAIGEGS